MSRPLAGQVALVTGASGAIGAAVARGLAARRVRLVLCGRSAERLEATREGLDGDPEVLLHPADLARDEAVEAVAARAEERFGGVDLLVHSQGAFHLGAVAEAPVAELDRLLSVNLRSPYLLTQRLLPSLLERRGQVVFINSTAGLQGKAEAGPYAASKAALRALADALREEVGPAGVRVLSVYPGRTASRMQQEVRRLEGKPYEPERWMQPDDVARVIVEALALPERAEVTELTIRQTDR